VDSTSKRKSDHIRICSERMVEAKKATTGFENVHLIHRCLPEVEFEKLDLSVEFLGFRFKAPIIISAMTGGMAEAVKINANLAKAAEELGIGMCLGSGRACLENPDCTYSFKVARENAEHIFISANIGFQEFLTYPYGELKRLVEMVEADALTIHLNPLHEFLQHDGSHVFRGVLNRLRELKSRVEFPLIVKEVGSGICREDAELLASTGVDALEASGVGGTSWAGVEYYRSVEAGDGEKAELSKTFWDWGIPTAISILEVKTAVDIPLVASGGIRSGLDVAKALVLGADLTGLALPLLKPAMESWEDVLKLLKKICEELKLAMVLTGSERIEDLKGKPYILTGFVREWATSRRLKVRCE
jgi:isopentenyl-diphosphate delta-isomerase